MATQACPNCQTQHDTSVYVSGQRLTCRCGIRFEVKRNDASVVATRKPGSLPPANAGEVLDVDSGVDVMANTVVPPSQPPEARPQNRPVASGPDPFAATAIRPPSSPEQPGEKATFEIPGYELLGLIGRGGMGEVWRAKQVSLGRTVAIKVLPDRLAKDHEFVARFEKEATALAALSHPNVIQIIDRGRAGDHYYFVMEYVAGRSLRDVMARGRLPPQEALKVVAQICRAIDYAHDEGIIHRDLKPENILLDERGHVKVADFGLAGIKGPGGSANLTATSVAMGTLNYMAPEQRRDAKNVDGRADLYSLGVILYELLTGELPIGRFKLPSEREVGLDVRLDGIVARTLDTDPAGRYARASMIGAELERLISSVSAVAPAARTDGGAPRPVKAQTSVIQKGFGAARYGLTLIGALTVLALVLRGPLADVWPFGSGEPKGQGGGKASLVYPPNSDRTLRAGATASLGEGDRLTFTSSFDLPGEGGTQELNANDGDWLVTDGKLRAVQAGNVATKARLRPRAYLSKRYFTTDDFEGEVQVVYTNIDREFDLRGDTSHFTELSLRFAGGVQVSVFAIPQTGVRLLWRYVTPDGIEIQGHSANDMDSLHEDEIPPPPDGVPFRLKLTLHRQKDGTVAEAFLNDQRVVRKFLKGLQGETAKLALGCRNLRCEFDELKLQARAVARPKKSSTARVQEE